MEGGGERPRVEGGGERPIGWRGRVEGRDLGWRVRA